MAKITLYGFSKWMHDNDKDLFELLTLPDGINKDTLVNNILLQGGEFETVYADPNFLHDSIGIWSAKWQRTFEKWVSALSLEYNPLDNYDRTETWTDTGLNTSQENQTDQGTNSSLTTSQTTTAGDITGQVSAYDSSDFSNKDKTVSTATDIGSVNSSGQTGNTMNASSTLNTSLTHNARIHGNIGVTTSMQLLESELSIDQWNIIEHITDLFLNEFCIMIY